MKIDLGVIQLAKAVHTFSKLRVRVRDYFGEAESRF